MTSPYLNERQRKILNALRHEPLDHYQLAADIQEAPFVVRAELRGPLKRERLVREEITREHHRWELTDRGERIVHHADQLELR